MQIVKPSKPPFIIAIYEYRNPQVLRELAEIKSRNSDMAEPNIVTVEANKDKRLASLVANAMSRYTASSKDLM